MIYSWFSDQLLAGIVQKVTLELDSGGHVINEGDQLILTASDGLCVQDTEQIKDGCLTLPAIDAHTIYNCDINVCVDLPAGVNVLKQVMNVSSLCYI